MTRAPACCYDPKGTPARYYDAEIGRFTHADSIVPNKNDDDEFERDTNQSIIALTVDFHEKTFVEYVAKEHTNTIKNGFWFQLKEKDQKDERQRENHKKMLSVSGGLSMCNS